MSLPDLEQRGLAVLEAGLTTRLSEQRRRQIREYMKFGFHLELGFSPEEYAAQFPEIPERPAEYREGYDFLLFVDPRIPLKSQLKKFNIAEADGLPDAELVDTEDQGNRERPYAVWTRQPVLSGRSEMPNLPITRSAILKEALAFSVVYPQMHPENGDIAANGSRWDRSDVIPVIERYQRNGTPKRELSARTRLTHTMPLFVRT